MRGEHRPSVTQGGWGAASPLTGLFWSSLVLSCEGHGGFQSEQCNAWQVVHIHEGTWPLVSETFVLGSFGGSCVVPQASAHGLRLQSLCSGEIVSELILEQGLLSH